MIPWVAAFAAGAGAADRTQAIVTVTGHISPSCVFTLNNSQTDVSLGDISGAGSHAIPFTLDCNVPDITYLLRSEKGGLRHIAFTDDNGLPGGFTSLRPYSATITVEDFGASGDFTATPAQLTAGSDVTVNVSSTGSSAPFNSNGNVTVTWSAPITDFPVAGRYEDNLTIEITPNV